MRTASWLQAEQAAFAATTGRKSASENDVSRVLDEIDGVDINGMKNGGQSGTDLSSSAGAPRGFPVHVTPFATATPRVGADAPASDTASKTAANGAETPTAQGADTSASIAASNIALGGAEFHGAKGAIA
mmetsp:Transcript_19921/g.60188  ORF Transcript_19921/g.60188 Transcript_19921/m.60188 type:complete len:130 (+) Transcript_19921:2399-2788(+)